MQEQVNTIGTLIEPDPIGFSFGAPGWTILLLILLGIILIYAILRIRQYRRMAYRRTAISNIETLLTSKEPLENLIFQVASLLKQVSIQSFGRETTVNRYGTEWLDFLEEKSGDQKIFSESSQMMIKKGMYQGKLANYSDADLKTYAQESMNWIKRHHV